MKVVLSDKVKKIQKDPNGSKALRTFIATAGFNEPRKIEFTNKEGQLVKFEAKLVGAD